MSALKKLLDWTLIIAATLCFAPGALAEVELKIAGQEYTYSKVAMESFRVKYPDISIVEEYGYLSMDDGTLQAVLQAGEAAPDLLLVSSGPSRIGVLAKHGLIRPIDDLLEGNKVTDRYQDWVIELIKAQDAEGRIFEVVEGVDVFQMYYSKEIFEKCGIEGTPGTWDAFLDVCQKLKDAGYQPIVAGFNKGLQAGWFGGLLLEAGAGKDAVTDVIFGEGRFDAPGFVLAGEMLAELMDKGYMDAQETLAIDYVQALTPFYAGSAAMCPIPQNRFITAVVEGTIQDDDAFGAFPLPSREAARPSRPTAGLATSWIVNNAIAQDKLDAVTKFLDFVASDEYLDIALRNGGSVIPVKKQMPSGIEMSSYFADAFQKLENGAGYNPSVYLPANAKAEWFGVIQGIAAGELTPEDGMSVLQVAIEADRTEK